MRERDEREARYWRKRVAAMSDAEFLRWVRGIARAKLDAAKANKAGRTTRP